MKFTAIASFALFVLTAGGCAPLRAQFPAQPNQSDQSGQASQPAPVDQEPHHRLMYATEDIQVYDVVVPSQQSALMYPQSDDYVSITLTDSEVTLSTLGLAPAQIKLPAGAVRFYKGGPGYTLANDGSQAYHALSIHFLNPQLTARGCRCSGGPTDAICQCPGASPLPLNWSLRMGQVLFRAVTLAPGATYNDDSTRTTRFLVAITPFDALDNTIHSPRSLEVRLPAGRYHWLGPGPHEIQNLATTPLRFVGVEF